MGARVNACFQELSKTLKFQTDAEKLDSLQRGLELLLEFLDRPEWDGFHLYVFNGTFSRNASAFINDLRPTTSSAASLLPLIGQYAEWWVSTNALSHCLSHCATSALQQAERLRPPVDSAPLMKLLKTGGGIKQAHEFAVELRWRTLAASGTPAAKEARKPGRPKGAIKFDAAADFKLYREYKESGQIIVKFAAAKGLPAGEVRDAINRHKNRSSAGGRK